MREFLDGLRARQYFDWALLYLEQLQDKSDLPADLKAIIPYERAMTFSESARHTVSPETQQRQLDQALGFLEQFTQQSPQHPLAATANSTRAHILLNKARVDILQAKLPSNKENRAEFQDRARTQVNLAREIFEKAHDQYQKAWETFPKFIDRSAEPSKHEARQKAEVAFMRAQLDLALCQFEEAQTYDKGTENHTFHLKKAVEQFRDIFTRYRTAVGGLHAQMWEAKCYEEMDDPQRALGIYAELLNHPSDGLKGLQDQVRHFRLICLNHDHRREYAMAIAEADEWLAKAKPIEQRSQAGQGIRWELVVAQEKLADPALLDLAGRIEVIHDSELDALGSFQRRTRVEVRLKNGRVLSAVGETRGGPDNLLTREDVTGKFAKVANRVLSREAQAPLVQLCDRLEKLDDAGQLSSLLEAPR